MGQSPPSTEYSSSPDDGLPFLQGTADFGPIHPAPQTYCGSPTKVASKDDILFSVRAPVGELNVADQDVGIGRGLCAIRPGSSLHPRFGWWALHEARHQLNFVSTGSTYEAVATEDVANMVIETAGIEEQLTIADYLDREVTRLDALVAAKERVLRLLAEKRLALITRAVTRGLDSQAPLRDSLIPWLGEIPAHWNVIRLAMCAQKITNGYVGPTRDILTTEGVRYLQSLHIKNNRIVFDENPYFVSEKWSLDHAKSILRKGDVLIVQTGDIGQVAVVPAEFAWCNCHALIIVTPIAEHLTGEFLAAVLNSGYGQQALKAIQTGAMHPHLNCGNVREVALPIPKLQEQCAIVEHIAEETGKLDSLGSATERTILLLKERRAALIAAAVTGKIDLGS